MQLSNTKYSLVLETYLDLGPFYSQEDGCISVWTHGSPSMNTKWFARAIYLRKRDMLANQQDDDEEENQSFTMFSYPDMDKGGVHYAHFLSNDKFGQRGACQAEHGFALPCKWLFNYHSYLQFRYGTQTLPSHQEGAIVVTMTMSESQHELIEAYLNNHQDLLDAAGEGDERREMIQSMLDDENGADDDNGGKRPVRLNTAQVDVLEQIAKKNDMMANAIG